MMLARPASFDWTGHGVGRPYGEAGPVWRPVGEPSVEDVYWMVWQLLSGRRFLGFCPGAGFGVKWLSPSGSDKMLRRCPFVTPSPEAI